MLVVINTWPLAARLDRIGRVDSSDGQYGLWQSAWVARALVTDPLHVYDANIFFPHRSTLAFSEPVLLAGILGLPAYLITGSPYATHNLAVLGFFLVSFLAAYALGRYLTDRSLPAIAFAISYAFSPYMFARTAQLPMMAVFGLPLAVLAMHRLVESPSIRTALAVAAALWLQALACGYYTVFALLVVSGGLIFFALQDGRWRNARYVLHSGLAALFTVVLLLPLLWPHIRLARVEGFSRPVGEAYEFGADWQAWLASSAWAHRWMLPWLGTWNEVLFPGFVPVVLALGAVWLALRGSLSAPVEERRVTPRALTLFYVLVAVFAAWCAFGPAGGLYSVLYRTVPLFAFIRSSGRFGLVTTMAVGALMTLALAHLDRRGHRAIVIVLTVLLAAELYSGPRPQSPALLVSPVYRALSMQPRGPAVEFPMFPRQLEINALYVLMSTAHWQPIVNGYGAFWPNDLQRLAVETTSFPSPDALERVKQIGVQYIVVHPRLYERYGLGTESQILAELAALQSRMTLIASDQNVRLYRVR